MNNTPSIKVSSREFTAQPHDCPFCQGKQTRYSYLRPTWHFCFKCFNGSTDIHAANKKYQDLWTFYLVGRRIFEKCTLPHFLADPWLIPTKPEDPVRVNFFSRFVGVSPINFSRVFNFCVKSYQQPHSCDIPFLFFPTQDVPGRITGFVTYSVKGLGYYGTVKPVRENKIYFQLLPEAPEIYEPNFYTALKQFPLGMLTDKTHIFSCGTQFLTRYIATQNALPTMVP